MKKYKHKLITLSILLTISMGVIYVINKVLAASAILKEMLDKPSGNNYYDWRFGKIYYTKTGNGSPLLLVHDLTPGSSGYEWEEVEKQLSKEYTVYTIDLLGCGRSDKPKITYTNFIYVQMLCDFVKNVIGQKTNIIASGMSTSFAIMACNTEAKLFDKTLLVNPPSLVALSQVPNKNSKMQKFLLELPIIGTMIYHMLVSRLNIENKFTERYYFNPFTSNRDMMEAYYEAAHKGDGNGKYLYASIVGRYTNLNILHGLVSVNNCISIIGGKNEPGIKEIIEDYTHYNPSVEYTYIKKAKHYPQIECPDDFLDRVGIYFSNTEV